MKPKKKKKKIKKRRNKKPVILKIYLFLRNYKSPLTGLHAGVDQTIPFSGPVPHNSLEILALSSEHLKSTLFIKNMISSNTTQYRAFPGSPAVRLHVSCSR